MSPLRILSLARRIITQCLRDRRTFGLIIIVPSVVMALLGYFYTTGSSSTVTLGVVNEDAGLGSLSLSRDVVDALRGQDNLTVIEVSRVDVNQSLKDKKLDGAIIFGPDFTKGIILNGTASADIITEGTDQGKSAAVNVKVRNAMTSAFAKMKNGSLNLNVSSSVIYGEGFTTLDLFAPYLLGVIAFAFIFIFTGVTFLRERSFGTFERLLVSPITRSEIILGYMLGFSLFAIIQSMIILLFAVFVLNVKIVGSIYSVVALQLLITLVSVNLGIFCSSFAKNELQAVQFIPLLILPQVFLDGMFWPISTLPGYLQVFSYIMPLTYANDALQNIMVRGYGIWDVWADVAILLAFAVAMIALSAISLNKRLQ
ncbi:ABC-type multidrug transport system, permease component [Methanocella conradii HZ254]|uniref:ABC-type multidrug transport system, permease component n=1 Tax=Methanocella conradii (strain DSM 24694 / JCM 17849 / CGMCC 1.5162 / HZ254) TaxID=1041930 RepID=H8I913_METCZ|nr:ABC transporter permease [Methanocella conradii]AFC99016.1 ABC-type multidrug transport system, permease component [Methanocella conradii HZ254]